MLQFNSISEENTRKDKYLELREKSICLQWASADQAIF